MFFLLCPACQRLGVLVKPADYHDVVV